MRYEKLCFDDSVDGSGYFKLLQREVATPMDDFFMVLKLSVASGTIASVVSEAQIFYPFREWVKPKSKFLGKLFSCGWCVGFYCAFALEAIYLPNIFDKVIIIDQILTSFCIAYGSGLVWLLITGLMKLTDK